MDKVLTIYFNKETGKYKHFQIVPLTEKFTREKLEDLVVKYNDNPEHNEMVKLYDDELLINLCADVECTRTYDNFLESMKDYLDSIEDVSRSIAYDASDLKSLLEGETED